MAKIGQRARGAPGVPAEHAAIPVWNAEDWYYEDFEIGDKIRSIRRTISEGEAMLFNALVLDMHPYVGDRHFAEQEGGIKQTMAAGAAASGESWGLPAAALQG